MGSLCFIDGSAHLAHMACIFSWAAAVCGVRKGLLTERTGKEGNEAPTQPACGGYTLGILPYAA